jgi:hypothetical protein
MKAVRCLESGDVRLMKAVKRLESDDVRLMKAARCLESDDVRLMKDSMVCKNLIVWAPNASDFAWRGPIKRLKPGLCNIQRPSEQIILDLLPR